MLGPKGSPPLRLEAERDYLRAEEVGSRSLLVVTATVVDVLGRPGPRAEPVVQRQSSLEDPAVACYGDQASQQPVEDDGLPQAHQRHAGISGSVDETPLQGGTGTRPRSRSSRGERSKSAGHLS